MNLTIDRVIKMDKKLLEKTLGHLPIPRIFYFEETDSTNEQGLKLAAEGAEEFSLVIANKQTAGRGRMGRRWVTKPGTSLAFSMILRPDAQEYDTLSLFSLLGGLAVCQAIKQTCPDSPVQVKWPNDVLIGGCKISGILAETNWQGDRLAGLVLGIGINLLEGSVPPATEVLFPATCIQAYCAEKIERLPFLAVVLEQIIALRPNLHEPEFLETYASHLAYFGQNVLLNSGTGTQAQGRLAGVDGKGQLILQNEGGERNVYPIGDLHLRPTTDKRSP